MKKPIWRRAPDINPSHVRRRNCSRTGIQHTRETDVILRENVSEQRHLASHFAFLETEQERNLRILNNHRQGFLVAQRAKQRQLERAGLTHLSILSPKSEDSSTTETEGVTRNEQSRDEPKATNGIMESASFLPMIELNDRVSSPNLFSKQSPAKNETQSEIPQTINEVKYVKFITKDGKSDRIGIEHITDLSRIKFQNTAQTRNDSTKSDDGNGNSNNSSDAKSPSAITSPSGMDIGSDKSNFRTRYKLESGNNFIKELEKDSRFVSIMQNLVKPTYSFPTFDGKFLPSGRPTGSFAFERIPTPDDDVPAIVSLERRFSRVGFVSRRSRTTRRSVSTAEVLQQQTKTFS